MLRGVAWSAALPAWQGPDEAAHYAYVERLAGGGFPPREREGQRRSPALDASLAASAFYAFRFREPTRPFAAYGAAAAPEPAGLSTTGWGASGATPYPPVYYVLAVPLYALPGLDTATARLFAVRTLSALLAGGLVLLTFALVREATASAGLALVGAALVTLPPMVGQASGIVNPDILLTLAVTGLAWTLVRLLRGGHGGVLLLQLALWYALATATKPVGAAAAATVVLPFLLIPPALRSRRAAALVTAGAAAVGVLVCALALLGGERVRSPLAFGARYLWDFYRPRLPALTGEPAAARAWSVWVESGVGSFGWLTVWLPPWAYALALLSLVTAVGLGVAGLRRDARALPLVASCAAALVLHLAMLHLAEYESLLRGRGPLLQGRYLLPVAPLAICAFLVAVSALPRRLRVGAIGAVGAVWALLSLLALDSVVRYFAA